MENDQNRSYVERVRRNLHYISTEEGAQKVSGAFQAIIMDTHRLLKQIKVFQKQDMNKVGIVAGLLATCEFRDTLSAFENIIKDFRTMDDINRYSKAKVEDSAEENSEESAAESLEDTPLMALQI